MNLCDEEDFSICKNILSSLKTSNFYSECLKPNILPGERILKSNIEEDTFYFLTQYRLGILIKKIFKIISIGNIYDIEANQTNILLIRCKDGKSLLLPFENSAVSLDWQSVIFNIMNTNNEIKHTFAFTYKSAYNIVPKLENITNHQENITLEYKRLGFEGSKYWEMMDVNANYLLCDSYPVIHILPSGLNVDYIFGSAEYRKKSRFPSITWRNIENGSILARSSQPCVGIFNYRSIADEELICSFLEAVHEDKNRYSNMIIVDARSRSAALANCAKGGGYENIAYYPGCQLKFSNISNIHTIRSLFYGISKFYISGEVESEVDMQYLENETMRYLQQISLILTTSRKVARHLYKGDSVLVHCSDGWDRTAQICSIAKLFIDPYYRTILGFITLIQRDWLEYGHMFYSRCFNNINPNDTSPIFLVFLDCIHQLMRQFPEYFEFNESFLLKIIDHVYSNLYGTFMCNSMKHRMEMNIHSQTNSLWDFLVQNFDYFYNLSYIQPFNKSIELLNPQCDSRNLVLWHNLFSTDRLAFEVDTEPKISKYIIKETMNCLEKLIDDAITEANSSEIGQSNQIDSFPVELNDPMPLDTNIAISDNSPRDIEEFSDYVIISSSELQQQTFKNFIPFDYIQKYKNDGTLPFNIKANLLILTDDGLPLKICSVYNRFRALIYTTESRLSTKECCSDVDLVAKENFYTEYDKPIRRSISLSSEKGYENIKPRDLTFVKWTPDHLATSCYRCAATFNLLTRKHHCRRCGQVFCRKCASKKEKVEEELHFTPVRVCDSCHQMISLQNKIHLK